MGITTDTPANLSIGAGNIYRNHASLGASVGANAFRIERELFTPQLNGIKGMLQGTDYIRRSEGVLETSFPEVSASVLAAGWPGSKSATGAGVTTIDEDGTRRIPITDYADWELQVERLGGGEFQFEVDGALQSSNFEGEASDDGLFLPRYILRSRWNPSTLTASPHRIRILYTAS